MIQLKPEEFLGRAEAPQTDLSSITVENGDFRGCKFIKDDLTGSIFRGCRFDGADFTGSILHNTLFENCSLPDVSFRDCLLNGATLRGNDLSRVDLRGADLYAASLEHAILKDVVHDKTTKWFDLHCPASGAFVGYKKCVFDRIVMLLIPADARRSSATMPTCRCDKAKVLTITNFDHTENYPEAWSLVDENFEYKVGEWVTCPDFNEDRFMDSTRGIHFWMTREEAIAY